MMLRKIVVSTLVTAGVSFVLAWFSSERLRRFLNG